MFLNKCSYIWNAGKPWVHISLVRVYCWASGRQAYLQGWHGSVSWKVYSTYNMTVQLLMYVPSPDQGTHMLDGQSNHGAHIHSSKKQVNWLTLRQMLDLQHHHQLPSTRHPFGLPSEIEWKGIGSVIPFFMSQMITYLLSTCTMRHNNCIKIYLKAMILLSYWFGSDSTQQLQTNTNLQGQFEIKWFNQLGRPWSYMQAS